MPATPLSLNAFRAAANAAAPAACLRVDASGVRAVHSLRAFFTLGSTHRQAMAAFVDALQQRYGEGIGTLVAIRQGLQAGPGLNARVAKRITGQVVQNAIAEAERIRTTHAVLLDIVRRGRMPDAIEALPTAWQRALDPEGHEDVAIARIALAEGHDLQSAIQSWADAWRLPLLPGEKEVLAEAVYAELIEKPRAEFENAEALYDRIKLGDCQILNQWLAVSTALSARTALAGFTGPDAASLRTFVAGRLCYCDAIRRGGYATGPKLEALVQEVRGDLEALSDERLQAYVRTFDPAFAARLSQEDLARLREKIMTRLGRAYAERPEGQAWNPSFQLEAARREVIAANLPFPLASVRHPSPSRRPAEVVAALRADFQAIWHRQRRYFGEGQAMNPEALRQLKMGGGRLSPAVQAALIDAALDAPTDDDLPPTRDDATTALMQAMDVLLTNMATVHAARTLLFRARGALAYRLQHDLPLYSVEEVRRLIAGGIHAVTGEMLRVLAASPDEAHWEMLLSVACDGKPAEQDWAAFCAACVDDVPPEMRAWIAASLAGTEQSQTPFGRLRAGGHRPERREDYEKAWQPRAFAGISPARAQTFLEALAAALSIPNLSFDEQELAS